jgi:hypothetical protein
MRSFREFLTEYGVEPRSASRFNLPNLDDLRDPNERPFGGYDSFAQVTQGKIAAERKSGKYANLYIDKRILENLGALAEQASSAIESNLASGGRTQAAYANAKWGNQQKTEILIPQSEVVGGTYPRIRPVDLEFAVKNGILKETKNYVLSNTNGMPTNDKYYILNVIALRNKMEDLKKQLIGAEKGNETRIGLAGKADQVLNSVMAKSEIPNYAARSVS